MILNSKTNTDTLNDVKDMVNDKTLLPAPGGGHHSEEYYGFMNQGGADLSADAHLVHGTVYRLYA
ncbi:hypothetical protein AAHB36_14185 [Bacillus velezensis]